MAIGKVLCTGLRSLKWLALGAMPTEVSVATKYGPLDFYGFHYYPCTFRASVGNATGVAWENALFSVTLSRTGSDRGRTSVVILIKVDHIGGHPTRPLTMVSALDHLVPK
jgi:hypothetical protein